MKTRYWAFLAGVLDIAASRCTPRDNVPDGCRSLPGDKLWPSSSDWNSLNETVSGRLIKTVPIGAVCHDPDYDEEECLKLQDQWLDTSLQ